MPKVKEQPKAEKVATVSTKEQEKVKAEAEKANRLILLEQAGEKIAPIFGAIAETEKKSDGLCWDLVDSTAAQVSAVNADKKELQTILVVAMSKAYDIKVDEFKVGGKGASHLPFISKVKRIASPVDKNEAKLIQKERSKGAGFNRVYELLRKPQTAPTKNGTNGDGGEGGGEGGEGEKGQTVKATIKAGDEASLRAAVAAFVTAATNAGFDYDVISEVTVEEISGHQAKVEANAEAEAAGA